ncbi:MAG: hypothetical protein JWP88_534 [Flaviaesturariibacter sp.]|nr:hypothetical protein [Flaviaesturariibacter sp.]
MVKKRKRKSQWRPVIQISIFLMVAAAIAAGAILYMAANG